REDFDELIDYPEAGNEGEDDDDDDDEEAATMTPSPDVPASERSPTPVSPSLLSALESARVELERQSRIASVDIPPDTAGTGNAEHFWSENQETIPPCPDSELILTGDKKSTSALDSIMQTAPHLEDSEMYGNETVMPEQHVTGITQPQSTTTVIVQPAAAPNV